MRRHRNDVILIAVLLIFAAMGWLYLSLNKIGGVYAVVTIDGEEVCRMPLDENSVTEIGENGKYNKVVVEDGQVYVSEASCPDRLCVNQGRKSFDGEMIVCLPNKMIVTVVGGDTPSLDAVTK